MKIPTVSVIVATYRRDESLCRALKSLAEQTFESIEIIVVDDNASRQWNCTVAEIVQNVSSSYGIDIQHIVCEKNEGSANARNIGIQAAKGEYITFLDDDDIYLPEKVEEQVKAMMQEDADYSITDLLLYNENDRIVDNRSRKYIKSYEQDALISYHLMYHMTGTDTLMFKSDYIREIGAFPRINIGDEFYLMAEAITNGGKFCYLPKCHVKAYVHSGQSGLSSGTEKIDGENALYEYKKTYFGKLSKKKIRFIIARHYAVLAYASVKSREFGKFFANAFKAFVSSPAACLRILVSR